MSKYFLSPAYGGVRILDYLTLLKILAGCVLLGYGSFTTEEAVKDYKFRVFGPLLESKESKSLLVNVPQKEWQQIGTAL